MKPRCLHGPSEMRGAGREKKGMETKPNVNKEKKLA